MKKFLLIPILVVITIGVLALSVRGNHGNPTENELDQSNWKEDGPFELSPQRGRFALTYSIIENKSLFFTLPLASFVTPDLGYHNEKYVSLFAPGVSFIVVPGYLVGKYFGASQVGTYSVISIFVILNSVLIYLIVRGFGLNKIEGFISSIIFAFATPAYAYGIDLYQHHISTFLILISLYLALNYKNWISLSLVWFFCAMAIPIDYPNLFLMFPIGIFVLGQIFTLSNNPIQKININVFKILTFLTMVIPIIFFLWFNNASYGNPLQFSGTVKSVSKINEDGLPGSKFPLDEIETPTTVQDIQEKNSLGFFESRSLINGLYILLVSPDRGLIFFAPVLILAIWGGYFLYKKHPTQTALLTSIIIINILLYGMWGDPWGGWAFGSRYLIPSYSIMAILLAFLLSKWRKNILLLLIFIVLGSYSIYINTAGALSSSANPPEIQVLSLEMLSGREEKYSFDRNIDFLKNNDSKSFAYRTWAYKYLSAWEYFLIIVSVLIGVLVISTIALYSSKDEKQT